MKYLLVYKESAIFPTTENNAPNFTVAVYFDKSSLGWQQVRFSLGSYTISIHLDQILVYKLNFFNVRQLIWVG